MPVRPASGALRRWGLLSVLPAVACAADTSPPPLRVAVATNFGDTFEVIAERFRERTGVEVRCVRASTGVLYAQIANGAPVDLFLAADTERPRRAEADGWAEPGSRSGYACGRLALCGAVDVEDGAATLRRGAFQHLALANPESAPYGEAALEVIEALGLRDDLRAKLVYGQNVGQAMQLVDSGAAEVGLVALSQAIGRPKTRYWPVPPDLHAPIVQEAVLLRDPARPEAARELLEFLRGPEVAEILAAHGYTRG